LVCQLTVTYPSAVDQLSTSFGRYDICKVTEAVFLPWCNAMQRTSDE